MTQNAQVIMRVSDLSHDARGVGDIDGKTFFVAGALPGEAVSVEIRRGRRRNKHDLEALAIHEPANERIEPECSYFGRCGGCAVQHMSYPAQIEFKQGVVAAAFAKIGKVEPQRWLDPVESPRWRYRRRARLGARYVEGKGRALVGFRERSASYITDMRECPVLAEPMSSAIGELADILTQTSIAAKVPQFEFTRGDDSAALIVRTLADPQPGDLEAFADFGQRHGLDVYQQPGGPGSIRAITPARPLYYRLEDHDVRIDFSPTDFIQVNARINELMVSHAVEAAAVQANESVLDLFCGVGNFSLPLAKHARELTGIEGDAGLVARAAGNAESNGLKNASFVCADLSSGGWSPLRREWDVVMLDPPRSGAAALDNDWLTMNPRRVVYVSCHPATLARDAATLCGRHGYRLRSAQIFDMFPNTHHVEAMAVFDRSDQD